MCTPLSGMLHKAVCIKQNKQPAIIVIYSGFDGFRFNRMAFLYGVILAEAGSQKQIFGSFVAGLFTGSMAFLLSNQQH